MLQNYKKEKDKARAVDVSSDRHADCTSRKCFRYGSEDQMITKCPKPPKDNEKRQRKLRFNEKMDRACNNRKNNSEQNIYASIARISSNDKRSSENYSESSQLTNWILDSGAMCHMTPEV